MLNEKLNIEKIISHWRETSDEDYYTMHAMFNSKSYHWALFLGHISLEKLLKAYYVKTKRKQAPPIHNLYRLAEVSDLDITDKYSDWLDTITQFNLHARYDDYKREFYHKCTKEYTTLWFENIKELRGWINQKLEK